MFVMLGLNAIVYQDDDPTISSATIIGIVVAAILLLLILIDVLCCCTNHAGIIALIYDQVHSKPVDDEDAKLGSLYSWRFPLPYCSYKAAPAHPSSLNLPQPIKLAPSPMEEKQPLRTDLQDPMIVNGVDKCNMSVEYDGKQVYTKPGEIIGKHSVV
ncbi:fasciclin-2-like isoform X1 [Photinus pyralis]|uniref:fasciclin-2-like isoform X1 n=1 Tax=Photinus pyralis TaxID=7054 RepID=UPI00126734CA|nr:fasciclin-2-like isoform X1 [Photinus pyralis]